MAESEDRIRELKMLIEQHQRTQTRAELEQDAARATVDKAKARLSTEFNVSDVTEAKAVLAEMTERLDQTIDAAFAMVEKANS
jgi:hypothetical protein